MYNGQIIKQLLSERKQTQKDLLDYMGIKENGTITRFTGNDIKASRLEQIADFFGLPIDAFFIRSREIQLPPSESARYETRIALLEEEVEHLRDKVSLLESLLESKDNAMHLMEQLLAKSGIQK